MRVVCGHFGISRQIDCHVVLVVSRNVQGVLTVRLVSRYSGGHSSSGSISWKERNVLFNDALNTFYLRLYGVRHMVKDHSDSEKGNPLPPHRLLFPINSKGSFICTIPQTG